MDSEWNQGDLIVNQSRLHITRTGNGSLPPIVLAHGLSDTGLCWHDTASDLAGIITALSLHRPIVGGHSMGGRAVTRLGAGRLVRFGQMDAFIQAVNQFLLSLSGINP